jgi:hypothetical protein
VRSIRKLLERVRLGDTPSISVTNTVGRAPGKRIDTELSVVAQAGHACSYSLAIVDEQHTGCRRSSTRRSST